MFVITVGDPQKVGDPISAHIVYTVSTKVIFPCISYVPYPTYQHPYRQHRRTIANHRFQFYGAIPTFCGSTKPSTQTIRVLLFLPYQRNNHTDVSKARSLSRGGSHSTNVSRKLQITQDCPMTQTSNSSSNQIRLCLMYVSFVLLQQQYGLRPHATMLQLCID